MHAEGARVGLIYEKAGRYVSGMSALEFGELLPAQCAIRELDKS